MIEHFIKEAKENAGSFCSGYGTDIYAVNEWIRTSDIRSNNANNVAEKLKVFTSQVHKEMTPGNKSFHFEHVRRINVKLKYPVGIYLLKVNKRNTRRHSFWRLYC